MPDCRNTRDRNAGTATYSLAPREVVSVWLLIEISEMSNSPNLKARWNASSGSIAVGTSSTPSICTRPSNKARVRSYAAQARLSCSLAMVGDFPCELLGLDVGEVGDLLELFDVGL